MPQVKLRPSTPLPPHAQPQQGPMTEHKFHDNKACHAGHEYRKAQASGTSKTTDAR